LAAGLFCPLFLTSTTSSKNHSAFAMATIFDTVKWALAANIYEVNLRQYTKEGTFAAFERELPRLRDMGVEILWFMPIQPISLEKRQGTLGSYYACSNYTTVNPEFGTLEDFRSLVHTAHILGFKLIIDWVANHTGYDHVWTKQHPAFYKLNAAGKFYDANGWEDVIDLDYNNPDLRTTMIEAMRFWIDECDIDGFRCDMAHLIPLEFWRAARAEFDKQKDLFWLAETEEPHYHEVFDATYGWKLLHAMEAVYRGEGTVQSLINVFEDYDLHFPPNAMRAFFTSNHDENSHSGSEYERFGDGAKAFAVLCATWKNSIPLVYSGQEMPNKKRLKFFDKDEIEWKGNYFLHNFYKTLFALRKNCPALFAGNVSINTRTIATNAPQNILAFLRKLDENEVLIILNLSASSRLKFKLSDDFAGGKFTSVFSGIEVEINQFTSFEIQKWEYFVYYRTVINGLYGLDRIKEL